MSLTKRLYMPEIYEEIDGIKAEDTSRSDLETQAKQAICSCWYYELANAIEETPDEELRKIIANPYHVHETMDEAGEWEEDCTQYQAEYGVTPQEKLMEQAEILRDSMREDGINV